MTDIDVSLWNVSYGANFECMFYKAKNLTSDFSNWSLSSVENALLMFRDCDKITTTPSLP